MALDDGEVRAGSLLLTSETEGELGNKERLQKRRPPCRMGYPDPVSFCYLGVQVQGLGDSFDLVLAE